MPHEIKWLIEGHVIFIRYWGDIEIEEFETISQETIAQYISKVKRPLMHTIIDIRETGKIPTNLAKIQNATKSIFQHPQMGWTTVYGRDDKIMLFISNMLSQIMRMRFRTVNNRDEAVSFLKTVDESLKDLA
jgi:hypothetical protein